MARDFSAELFGSPQGAGKDFGAELFGAEPPPDTGFTGAMKSSYERMKGEGALLAGKVGLMSLPEAEEYKKQQDVKAEKTFKPTQEGWTEAPFTKFKELAGGSLPYMVAPAVAGTAAALAAPEAVVLGGLASAASVAGFGGATAASAAQFTGSNLARQMETGKKLEDTSLLTAGATAIPQAALDTAANFLAPGLSRIFGKAGIKVAEKEVGEIAKKGILSTAGEYAYQGAKLSGIEGATEAGQQFLERMQAGLNLTDAEARKEYYDNFLGGAILGGVIGGAGHAYEKAFPQKAAKALPDTPPENKQEAQDTAVKILALPAPEEIIADTRRYDPVMNPLGNFIDDDLKDILTPAQIKRINDDRKEAGKPKINSYSVEDVHDAIQNSTDDQGNALTPEAQQGILNSLITFKSGYDGTMPVTPETVLQMAEQKNVEPNTQGFNDFLTRVTGLDDLNDMQPPQLYAAWKALSNLDDSPQLRILPQGTNAVRFTEKQYTNALDGLQTVFGELGTDALSATSVKAELKEFSGLERDADVDALYRAAVQRGDLEENFQEVKTTEGVKHPLTVSFAGKVEALPGGFDIRNQAFKQDEIPEHYEVRNGRVVQGRAPTMEEAQKILDEQTQVNAEVAKKPEAAITKLRKDIDMRNRVLAEKRATGYYDTDGYKALEAHLNGLNRRAEAQIAQHENDIRNLTNPLSIVPSETTKPVVGKKHVFYEGEKPLASFENKTQAEEYGMMRKNENGEYAVPDSMLQQIIDTAPTTKGILPKRYAEMAKKELARRQGTAPKGIEIRRSIYNPEVDAALDGLRQTLLPQLKKFGLEKVGLRIVNSIADGQADGAYLKSLITVALDAKNPMGVLRHETIHALKDLGAFTPQEWKVLENKAKSEWVQKYIKDAGLYKAYQDAYKKEHGNLNGFDAYINEEAIAEAFKDFANNKPPAGLIGNIFYRIGEMLRGIANVFKRLGFTSSDQIFRKIEAGEMRTAAEPTTTEKKSYKRFEPEGMKVVFEVAPDPNNTELSERWNAMPQAGRLEISNRVAEQIVKKALQETGFKGKVESQVGSYLNDTNPSFALVLQKGDPVVMAKFLGHALSQDSMMVLSPTGGKGLDATGAITVAVGDKTADEVDAIYQKLRKIRLYGEQPIGGQSTINGNMVILNYSNVETEKLAREIDYALGREYNVEHTEIYTAFPEKEDYNYASTEDVGTEEERNLRGRSNSLRAEASQLLQEELDSYRPPEPTVRPSRRSAEGIVLGEKQDGALSYEGTHYGKVQANTLVGRMYGSGIRGAERERLDQSNDSRIKKRVYFYIEKPNGQMPLREAGLGPHIHRQNFDNILGPSPEMNRISNLAKGDSNKFESLVVDEGFDGYAIPDMGVMVILNHDVPVKYEGSTAEGKYSLKTPEGGYKSNALNIMEGVVEKPDLGKKPTVEAIAKYFDGLYPERLDYNDPTNFAQAVDKAKEELKHQIAKENSGLDWYDEDIAKAFKETARVIPELKKPNKRVLFTIIAGIMSPETTARDNWVIAAQAFKHYIDTGEIPGNNPATGGLWQGGVTSPNKRTQLNLLNNMVKDLGEKGALNWLTTEHTVREINEARAKYGNIKSGIGGKATDMVPALYTFGPKVGPFVSNLNGIHDVTVDKWMTRTFNRYFGTMIGANGEVADAPTEPQRRAIKNLINEVAKDANVKPYQAQSLLWFFEQSLFRELGAPAPSYGFSDGATKFLGQNSQGRDGGGAKGAGSNAPSTATLGRLSIRAPETPEFKRWFGDSKIVDEDGNPKVMYHGTARDITEFKPKQANAIFVTENAGFADHFTSASEDYMRKELWNKSDHKKHIEWIKKATNQAKKDGYVTPKEASRIISESEMIDGTYGTIPSEIEVQVWDVLNDQLPSKANIMPVYVRAENPFDYENPKHVEQVLAEVYPNLDMKNSSAEESLQLGNWERIESKEYQNAIKALGFDSFYVKEGDVKNLAVYNPNQIKSATGNIGTYDIKNPDIRYSLNQEAVASDVEETGRRDNLIYLLQDKQIDLKRVIDNIRKYGKEISDKWNAYLQEELFHGRSAARVKYFIDRELQPLLRQMSDANITLDEMDDYLLARHAKEANAYIRTINKDPKANSGMTDKEADDYIAAIPAPRRQAFERIAKQVDAMTKETRQLMVDYGLEKQSTIDTWEKTYKNYVPLFREETEGSPISTGRGYSIRGSTTRTRTGSSKGVVDVLANIAMQRERTIARGEKNRVGNALYGLVAQNPDNKFWMAIAPDNVSRANLESELLGMGLPPDVADNLAKKPKERVLNTVTGEYEYKTNPLWLQQPNVFLTRVNGEDRVIVFNMDNERASRMAVTFNNLDANQQSQALAMMGTAGEYVQGTINTVGKATRYFAAVNTQYNPAFSIYNFMRDIGGAVLNLQSTKLKGKEFEVISNAFTALKDVYQDLRLVRAGEQATSKWAQIFEEFELEGGKTGFRDLFNSSEDRAKALQAELDSFKQGGVKTKAKAVFDWLSDFNEAVENSIRVSAYASAKEMGMSNAQAASLAKNLTVNFNRTGAASKNFTTLYAFFNASVQGSARIAQTLMNPDGKLSSAGKMIVKGGLSLGVMQAVLLAIAGFEEDEPPDFVKDKNFIIPYGDKKYLAIPMPLGFNVFPSFGRRATEFAMSRDKNVGKAMFGMTEMVLDAFNPLGSATFAQTLTPTLLDPIVALAENKDFSGRPIAKEDINSLNPTPGYTRGKENASAVSTGLAYAVNLLSGGSEFKKGVISPTPDQIDYLIGQITGGVGREILKVEKTLTAKSTGEELATYNIPVVGRMLGDVKQKTVETSRFYDNVQKMNEHQHEIEGLAKSGRDASEYLQDNPEAALYKVADKIYNKVSDLKHKRKELKAKGATDADLKGYDEAILLYMQAFNEAVKDAKSSR
jgi:hypothetical protein